MLLLDGWTNGREYVLISTTWSAPAPAPAPAPVVVPFSSSLSLSFFDNDSSLRRDVGYRIDPMDMNIDRPSPRYATVESTVEGSTAAAFKAGVKSTRYHVQ